MVRRVMKLKNQKKGIIILEKRFHCMRELVKTSLKLS